MTDRDVETICKVTYKCMLQTSNSTQYKHLNIYVLYSAYLVGCLWHTHLFYHNSIKDSVGSGKCVGSSIIQQDISLNCSNTKEFTSNHNYWSLGSQLLSWTIRSGSGDFCKKQWASGLVSLLTMNKGVSHCHCWHQSWEREHRQ